MGNQTEQQHVGNGEDALLPLGSIVLLHEGSKKLMIYGRKQLQITTNRLFDYLGVIYPEGYIDENYSYLFNQEDIEMIVHVGYTDVEEEQFQLVLQSVPQAQESTF
ncbi:MULTISPECIES: DUF4176 domain-containing protein [Paenibacillus]|uniref:DUF4176 domain-containing protein n=2 Tax=Paenibacillus TaxID=44249 RepID=A0AAJ2JX19_9BACL|nr:MULTISPECIES: DUF4176 domain-containing protein [Paenibacillus]EPY14080.1 hypothetical protein PAAL66ix_05294 [Paenibacillus alvei A6-6i-x]MCM3289552.1 DUF4176 domain-containing protein [Paenibacillus sp. MER 180]MCY9532694.1 DUF4176 domain-containing protein [Paenibacillus alvei]MDT8975879.1 DUF4176 domain-containing protein [Paenibacillus sp. chi10]SDE64358.1 protein of unknown function [Paenibacillus sp. cl6col]